MSQGTNDITWHHEITTRRSVAATPHRGGANQIAGRDPTNGSTTNFPLYSTDASSSTTFLVNFVFLSIFSSIPPFFRYEAQPRPLPLCIFVFEPN